MVAASSAVTGSPRICSWLGPASRDGADEPVACSGARPRGVRGTTAADRACVVASMPHGVSNARNLAMSASWAGVGRAVRGGAGTTECTGAGGRAASGGTIDANGPVAPASGRSAACGEDCSTSSARHTAYPGWLALGARGDVEGRTGVDVDVGAPAVRRADAEGREGDGFADDATALAGAVAFHRGSVGKGAQDSISWAQVICPCAYLHAPLHCNTVGRGGSGGRGAGVVLDRPHKEEG